MSTLDQCIILAPICYVTTTKPHVNTIYLCNTVFFKFIYSSSELSMSSRNQRRLTLDYTSHDFCW